MFENFRVPIPGSKEKKTQLGLCNFLARQVSSGKAVFNHKEGDRSAGQTKR